MLPLLTRHPVDWESFFSIQLGKRCSRNAASFDLNGRVPVIENVFGVLVLNAPGQMIMKTDTDLCIVKGLCCSETAIWIFSGHPVTR
jgi:hypothetical protein